MPDAKGGRLGDQKLSNDTSPGAHSLLQITTAGGLVPGVLLFLEGYARAWATREGMSGAPGAGAVRRDSGGGLRRLRSTAAGLVRALRRAVPAPSLPLFPLHEGIAVIGLLRYVFAMSK